MSSKWLSTFRAGADPDFRHIPPWQNAENAKNPELAVSGGVGTFQVAVPKMPINAKNPAPDTVPGIFGNSGDFRHEAVSGAEMAQNSQQADFWQFRHFGTRGEKGEYAENGSDPTRCAHCGEEERSGAMIVPFGTDVIGHTWLHDTCWPAWYARRRGQALPADAEAAR